MVTILTSLNIAGLVLALFFISLILTKKNKYVRDYLLVFFITLLGTYLLIKYVFQYDLYNSYPIIIYLDFAYWVLLGPTLYMYTLTSIKGENHLHLNYLYTLIPAVLVFICFYEYIFGNPTDFFNYVDRSLIAEIGTYIWLYNSPIFYILTVIALRKHQKKIKNYFSFSKSIDLKWLYYLTSGFAVFIFFIISRDPIRFLFDWEFPITNYSISMGIVFIYILGIGFYGYKQSGIFDEIRLKAVPNNEHEIGDIIKTDGLQNHQSYQKSSLNKEEAKKIIVKLKSLMKSEQPYLDGKLNLTELAIKVNVSTHKLSQVINEYLNKNFFDFVNEYRIEQAKELLSDPNNNHYKIISLAYDSGFSTKSTFYNLFRKLEGMTPSEYRLKHQLKVG